MTTSERIEWYDSRIAQERELVNNLRVESERIRHSIDSALEYIETLKAKRQALCAGANDDH